MIVFLQPVVSRKYIVYENRKFARNKLLTFREKITKFQLQFLCGELYTELTFCSHF